jgi:hypothetical protein
MTSPFERYGIEHLSPSSINVFLACPALFVLEKVLKHKTPVGCAAHRGTAVEDGIMHGLLNGADDDECVEVARKTFAKRAAFSTDPSREKEEASLAGMVKTGLAELRPYGKPSATQGLVSHNVEGLAVPIIGYFDAEWEDHGILLDLKTTHAVPSKIKTGHARQVALYAACRGNNTDLRLSYCSTKKIATYQLENARDHVAALERVALTIQRFLAVSDDPQELVGITAPDTDSFYFNDATARAAAFEVWGI